MTDKHAFICPKCGSENCIIEVASDECTDTNMVQKAICNSGHCEYTWTIYWKPDFLRTEDGKDILL